jgi:spore coat protein CotH
VKRLVYILVFTLSACEAPWAPPPNYQAMFKSDRLVEWNITVGDGEWQKLNEERPNPACQECRCDRDCWDVDRPADWGCEDGACVIRYVEADVEVNGVVYPRVGLRYMGNRELDKKSMRIRFNRFRSSGRFYGVKRINLRSNRRKNDSDPTLLREALALELFRRAGVPAPRYSFVWVTVNGEPWGVYTLVEQVDKKFLADRFGEDRGNLYKIEKGGLLEYEGSRAGDYPYFDDLYELKTNEDAADHSGLIELLRVLAQTDDAKLPGALERVLDVDGTLRALAVNSWLANVDSYSGTGDNLYLYQDGSGRFRYIPWDLNRAFGNYHGKNSYYFTDDLISLNPDRPLRVGPRLLVDRLLGVEELRQRYHDHLQELIDSALHPDAVAQRMEALRDLIWDRAHEDALKGFVNEEFETAFTRDIPEEGNPERVPGLVPFFQARDRVVRDAI